MQANRAGVCGKQPRELHHLVPRALARVGITVKMHGAEVEPALCHHVTSDGAVDTAGNKQHGPSRGADGHTVRAWDLLGVDIRLFADLDRERDLGLVDVHVYGRELFQNEMTELAVDLVRIHEIVLVRPAGEHLEAEVRLSRNLLLHQAERGFDDAVPILIHAERGADRMDAEYLFQPFHSLVKAVLRDLGHVDPPLLPVHLAVDPPECAFNVFDQLCLEKRAVQALEVDLGVANKYNSFHRVSIPYIDIVLLFFHELSAGGTCAGY